MKVVKTKTKKPFIEGANNTNLTFTLKDSITINSCNLSEINDLRRKNIVALCNVIMVYVNYVNLIHLKAQIAY